MNSTQELYYLNRFKELYENFPPGEIIKSEQPDFIVQSNDSKIGIEITEIFQDTHLEGYSKFQKLSSDRHFFTNELISQIQNFVSFPFHMGIGFNDFKLIKRQKKDLILNKAFCATIKHILILENKQSVIIEDFDMLPEEINSIQIGRFDGLKESYDVMPEGGAVSIIENIHINNILNKKHRKLGKYQICSEQWLLIREGNYYAGSFAEIKVSEPITTLFDKLFILRSNYNKIIELK
ncbi:hypothetical protein LZ575_15665 [Antarcticibacterium sp. 1MA-6-2]|uniref:hypothetical protein n=1 Tax=Antarcticibacterium sp. 1MA-6-2 TaxID=2908210 RepID=UPI001F295C29|nr:hypothetical protein [Antarcticibacterium sp. 1MA-6-2]UJH90285.1 hypothetical protein LZ575_15665 [Antarcticibacterium sp. 1MA-6-2]